MASTVIFRVLQKELFNALKQLQKVEKSAKKKKSTLEVTIVDGYMQLLIPGIQLQLSADTIGSAKFTVSLSYFVDIIKAEQNGTLHFTLSENALNLRVFTFSVHTTFFQNDSILRSINLPLNYVERDIAKLYLSEKYTEEEIKFNKLDQQVEESMLSGKKGYRQNIRYDEAI